MAASSVMEALSMISVMPVAMSRCGGPNSKSPAHARKHCDVKNTVQLRRDTTECRTLRGFRRVEGLRRDYKHTDTYQANRYCLFGNCRSHNTTDRTINEEVVHVTPPPECSIRHTCTHNTDTRNPFRLKACIRIREPCNLTRVPTTYTPAAVNSAASSVVAAIHGLNTSQSYAIHNIHSDTPITIIAITSNATTHTHPRT